MVLNAPIGRRRTIIPIVRQEIPVASPAAPPKRSDMTEKKYRRKGKYRCHECGEYFDARSEMVIHKIEVHR